MEIEKFKEKNTYWGGEEACHRKINELIDKVNEQEKVIETLLMRLK